MRPHIYIRSSICPSKGLSVCPFLALSSEFTKTLFFDCCDGWEGAGGRARGGGLADGGGGTGRVSEGYGRNGGTD